MPEFEAVWSAPGVKMMRGNVPNDYALGRRARVLWCYAMFEPSKWSLALPRNLVPGGIPAMARYFAPSRPATGTHTKRAAFAAARDTPAGHAFRFGRAPCPLGCGLSETAQNCQK